MHQDQYQYQHAVTAQDPDRKLPIVRRSPTIQHVGIASGIVTLYRLPNPWALNFGFRCRRPHRIEANISPVEGESVCETVRDKGT